MRNAAKEFGDNELAIQSLENAIALRPDFAQAHLNLGLTSSYLSPNHELVEKWRPRFASKKKITIGIAWQGDPTYRWDHLRSVPLKLFKPLVNLPNIELVSLQKGNGSTQLNDVVSSFPIEDLGESIDVASGAFMDTAAIMTHLDLVISPDTAIVHLAGALGVPTWLMLPTIPHWVWLLDRTDSPWYPSTRLFRQTDAGTWGPVIESMSKALSSGMVADNSLGND